MYQHLCWVKMDYVGGRGLIYLLDTCGRERQLRKWDFWSSLNPKGPKITVSSLDLQDCEDQLEQP